jgi:DNA topoisomerase IA
MPHILDEAVKQLKKKGWGTSSAYAIGTSTLQKSGSLKKGTNQPTKKGIARGAMTRAERHRTAP